MKTHCLALTLSILSLPASLPALAKGDGIAPLPQVAVERRSHHCDTPEQQLSPRCSGV